LGKSLQTKLNNFNFVSPTKNEVNWITGKGVETLGQFDVVIHLLAIYGGLPYCLNNRVKMGLENLEINSNVYRYIEKTNPAKIITIGSGCEYPGYLDGYLKEEDLGAGKLHQSVIHYGYSKLMQLQLCYSFLQERGTQFEHLVLANMYGPYDRFDLHNSHVVGGIIYKFKEAMKNNDVIKLMGTGAAVRDLIYVDDVSEMIVRLLQKDVLSNRPLNCGTGVGTPISTLVNLLCQKLNYHKVEWGNASEDGALLKVLDMSKTKDYLNWTPETSLEEGLDKTLDWYFNE